MHQHLFQIVILTWHIWYSLKYRRSTLTYIVVPHPPRMRLLLSLPPKIVPNLELVFVFAFYVHGLRQPTEAQNNLSAAMSQASFSETAELEVMPPCPPNAPLSNQPNCADILTRSQPLWINAARTWSPWKLAPGSNIPRKGTTFTRVSWLALSMEDDFIISWLNLTPNLLRGLRLLALSPSPCSFPLFTLTKLRTSCLGTNSPVLQSVISRACCLQQRGRTQCNSLCTLPSELCHILVLATTCGEITQLGFQIAEILSWPKARWPENETSFSHETHTGTKHCRRLCLGELAFCFCFSQTRVLEVPC